MASSLAKVKVYVRIRPLLPRELSATSNQRSQYCITLPNKKEVSTLRTVDGKEFIFDCILTEKVNQNDVFSTTVLPLVDGLFKGFNATVFAFGQTGSGKTFTMGSRPTKHIYAS
jgi:hypothetical protein